MGETKTLKALADAVLRRDAPRDDQRDKVSPGGETQDGAVRRPECCAVPLEAESAEGNRLGALMLATVSTAPAVHPGPAAVCLHSRRFGCDVWVVREPADLELIRGEAAGQPIMLAEELPALRQLDDAALRAVLDAKAAMPGTHVVADTGEPLTPARRLFPATGPGSATA